MRIGKYESSDGSTGTAVTFLLIGVGVGAALGLLLAPKTGRQLRKDLRRSYDDVLETASDWTDEAKERLEDVVEKSGDFADEMRAKAKPLSDLLRRSSLTLRSCSSAATVCDATFFFLSAITSRIGFGVVLR
jgi:gas vesicle protein